MMNWILVVMGAIASIVVAMLVGGLMAPARIEIARTIRIAARREDVWRVVHDVQQIPDWSPRLPAFEVASETAPSALTLRLRNDSQEIVGEWHLRLDEVESHTNLSVSASSVTGNPIARFLRSFRNRNAQVDAFLGGAAEQLGDYRASPRDQ
ncbi:MAG TPA: SRPBCC family protein [Gemmatimonas sp.]|uniref:SRPBCC family protein n=1 Tax=Gemmatimonas sp. TaxID=1962908 RepID=UPI002EDA556B